jgi:hypothetical protein
VVGRHVHRRPMDQSGERGADDLRPVATIEITENGTVVGNGSGPKTRTSARVWVFFLSGIVQDLRIIFFFMEPLSTFSTKHYQK